MLKFIPERYAEVDVELAGIEAFLADLTGELDDISPITDKRGRLWLRADAAGKAVVTLRWELAQRQESS